MLNDMILKVIISSFISSKIDDCLKVINVGVLISISVKVRLVKTTQIMLSKAIFHKIGKIIVLYINILNINSLYQTNQRINWWIKCV